MDSALILKYTPDRASGFDEVKKAEGVMIGTSPRNSLTVMVTSAITNT